MLHCMLGMLGSMNMMAMGQMRMVGSFLVIARFVLGSSFLVMARSVLVVLRCLFVAVGCFV